MRIVYDFRTGQATTDDDFVKEDLTPPKSERRQSAIINRTDFCLALKRMGILPLDEAVAAARGDWPATFAAFAAQLTADQAAEVQIRWAATQSIHYTDATLQALAMTVAQGDPTQATALLDQIFGVQ